MAEVLFDLFIVSILLLIGFFARKHIGFFQKYHIPAALIGGFVGLVFGPQLLGTVAPIHIPITDTIGGLPTTMICFVLGLSVLKTEEDSGEKVTKTALAHGLNMAQVWQLQLLVGLIMAIILGKFWNLPIGSGASGIMGFYQGHGNATAYGGQLAELTGWADAQAYCITIATTGLLSGIFVGIIMINIAFRRGWTHVKEMRMDNEDAIIAKKGFIPAEKRKAIGFGVTSPDSLDPLAFQAAIPLIIYGVAELLRKLVVDNGIFFLEKLPTFVWCMLLGLLLNVIMKYTGTRKYLDTGTISRIMGVCMDILVCSAMATLSIKVVMTYAVPLLVMTIGFILCNFFTFFFVGYKTYETDWLECAVGGYGNVSGVAATGMMLVRTADPDGESIGMQVVAYGSASTYIYTLPYIAMFAIWSVSFSPIILIGVTFVIWLILMLIIRKKFWIKERKISTLLHRDS